MIKRRDSKGSQTRTPTSVAGSTNQEKPIFSLVHLQNGHSLLQCNQQEKAAFADTIFRLSGMTWGEIQKAPRKGLGHETIAHTAIKAPFPDVITPDVSLVAFRCHGLAPMVGFRDGAVFHVVWMDRDFTLYNHDG